MKNTLLLISALSLSTTSFAQNTDTRTQSTPTELDTVKVSADFRQLDLMQIPSAITVVDENAIKQRNADHLESILSLAPNVNFAAGSSRGRYFQIRGIGERSQFIDPINPSVGLIIDGIDMTGLGGAATLFDVEQVEILRGPQGTAFGANALAGAINIKSKQPTKETEGYLEAKTGNYNSQGLGGAISGSLNNNVQARFAINQFKTDGYIKNIHLNKDNTNNINETVARGQLVWQINPSNDLNISLLKTDINNGYDAFSLDNTRETYSNKPGKDEQDTSALSMKWASTLSSAIDLEFTASGSQNKSTYGYDEDWAYGEYTWFDDDDADGYTADPCDTSQGACLADIDGYSTEDYYIRDNDRQSMEIRLLSGATGRIFNESTQWVAGLITTNKNETLDRNYTYPSDNIDSKFNSKTTAIYSELSTQISHLTSITYGLRIENRDYDYRDSYNLDLQGSELLNGGKITIESLIDQNHITYINFAKGYKAGGINVHPILDNSIRDYKTESNYSTELGLKSSLFTDKLKTKIALFYVHRDDQQVKQSFPYLDNGKPKFKDYIANATEGRNYGFELEGNLEINEKLQWALNIGYLKTEFIDFSFDELDANKNTITITKDGREQAHAPEWSALSSLHFSPSQNWSLTIEAEGKDSFYFSNSHDSKSNAYSLLHSRIEYSKDSLTIALNGRNLTDKEYSNRGFNFGIYGNDPRDFYAANTYTQLAEPRLISLSARYDF